MCSTGGGDIALLDFTSGDRGDINSNTIRTWMENPGRSKYDTSSGDDYEYAGLYELLYVMNEKNSKAVCNKFNYLDCSSPEAIRKSIKNLKKKDILLYSLNQKKMYLIILRI